MIEEQKAIVIACPIEHNGARHLTYLSFAESGFLKPKIITDQDIMKKVSHDVSKLIYDNLDKMNFNLGVVGIHFSRVDQQDIT